MALGLMPYLQCARHCAELFTYFTFLNLRNNPIKQMNDDLHGSDKETETQEVKYSAQVRAASSKPCFVLQHVLSITCGVTHLTHPAILRCKPCHSQKC